MASRETTLTLVESAQAPSSASARTGRQRAESTDTGSRNDTSELRKATNRSESEGAREEVTRQKMITTHITEVKSQIARIRSNNFIPEFKKTESALKLIRTSLNTRGEYFHDNNRSYVFVKDTRRLLPLEFGDKWLEVLLLGYGLLPRETITRHVIDGLRLEALASGKNTVVHAFSYYNTRTCTVYIYDFQGGIYRITADQVTRVDNGTDGVLFIQNPHWAPFKLLDPADHSAIDWQSKLLSGIHFATSALSEADQRLLFSLWVLALFFPQIFPTRVILAVIGEKGSGKTSLLRRIGRLLFGSDFNVTALTAKPDDFDAAITTDPLVVADNADDAPKWFPDKLAVLATGGMIKRRILYTTNTLGEYPIIANLAVTSRTPNFQREDVAERLLPLYVQRIELFDPESALDGDLQTHREPIIGALVKDIQRAIGELLSQQEATYCTKFRMADFADFVLKIAPVVSTRDNVLDLLDRLCAAQVEFSSENDPLIELICTWLKDDTQGHVNVDRSLTVTQLGKELAMLAEAPYALPWEANNPQSFGQYFRNHKGTLREFFELSERRGQGGATIVSFSYRLKDPLPMDDSGFGGLGEEEYEQFDQDRGELYFGETTEVEK